METRRKPYRILFYFVDITNGNAQPGNLIVLMLMYGLAFLPSMYLIQFAFTGPATGYVVVAFFNLLTGMWCIVATDDIIQNTLWNL